MQGTGTTTQTVDYERACAVLEAEKRALLRICRWRKHLIVASLAFLPSVIPFWLLGVALGAAEVGALVGFGVTLGIGLFLAVTSWRLHWSRCPRCGDFFFLGFLKAPNPEFSIFGSFGILPRRHCVNCKIGLDC